MVTEQQSIQILKFREKDNQELQKKKENFLTWINTLPDYKIKSIKKKIEGMNTKYRTRGLQFDTKVIYDNGLRHFEMWDVGEDNPIETTAEKCQFINPNANTRTKINSETCYEIDKLDYEKAFKIICEVISSLIRNKLHFSVWYAKGQRSPHIRIYDFEELEELTPQQRIKAQVEFWKKQVPFGCFQYTDTGIFIDDHNIQLEFSIHYRHRTPFDLLFEYIPEVEECKD